MSPMTRLIGLVLALACTGANAQDDDRPVLGTLVIHREEPQDTPEEVFMEAWRVVRSAFYDPNLHGVDWEAIRDELRPRAAEAKTPAELSAVINDALSRLEASHTAHYHRGQREYYEVLNVFNPDGVPPRPGSRIKPGPVTYVGIGLATQLIDGKTFVLDVYDGGPAAAAGIKSGDELLGVEDGPWGDIEPFSGREGHPTRVHLRRRASQEAREVVVTPERIHPRELFVRTIEESAKLIVRDGGTVAYVRIRSYASPLYQEALCDVLESKFGAARAEHPGLGLILDIRGGWGGAQPRYLEVFNSTVPEVVVRHRDGRKYEQRQAWDPAMNPVVMLVDGGSRSGKEILAYGFKKAGVGTIIGETTAGAVLAGTLRPLADGSVLYVAVADVIVDGERIEGRGVEPDVVVRRELPYSAGEDNQINAAIDWLLKEKK